MKATVKTAFTDRENMSDVYYPGDVFEGTEERVNELAAGGYVEAVEAKPKPARRRKTTATTKE